MLFVCGNRRLQLNERLNNEFYLNYNVRSSCTSKRLSIMHIGMCMGACRHHATTPTINIFVCGKSHQCSITFHNWKSANFSLFLHFPPPLSLNIDHKLLRKVTMFSTAFSETLSKYSGLKIKFSWAIPWYNSFMELSEVNSHKPCDGNIFFSSKYNVRDRQTDFLKDVSFK